MMPAYAIGNITVLDHELWAEYRSKVTATVEPWKGELVFRGKKARVLGGECLHTDTVVIRFPSLEALDNWFNSSAYQALIPLRKKAANIDLISYQSER